MVCCCVCSDACNTKYAWECIILLQLPIIHPAIDLSLVTTTLQVGGLGGRSRLSHPILTGPMYSDKYSMSALFDSFQPCAYEW